MSYYYIGLRLESPEKEKAMEFREEALRALNLQLSGKVYLSVRENPTDNQNFCKLLDHLQPGDTLIFLDIVKSTQDIYNLLELLSSLNGLGVNIINMVMSRVNNLDYPSMYDELGELLLLIQNYTVFIYHICKGDVDNFNWECVPRLENIDTRYSDFVEYTIRYEIFNYKLASTVGEVFGKLTNPKFRDYFLKYYPQMESLTLSCDMEGLESFLNFAKYV